MAMAERFALLSVVTVVLGLSSLLRNYAHASHSPWFEDGGLKGDANALLAFKENLLDPEQVFESWKIVESPCSWRGVECGRVGADVIRVVGLKLKDAGLKGSISAKLGELSELEVLDLMGNNLKGRIPEELGNCKRLMVVNLNRNGLVGSIPDGMFSRLPNLREFTASDNKLSGQLPALIAKPVAHCVCTALKLLDLSHNRQTSVLPRDLHLCSQLVEIRLDSNYFKGAITGEYEALRHLEVLHLDDNILAYQLPQELKRCTKLQVDPTVRKNFLKREVPTSSVKLRLLMKFDVRRQGLRRSLLSKTSRHKRSTAGRWGLGIAVGLVAGTALAAILALLTRAALEWYSTTEDLKNPIIFNKKITPSMLEFLEQDDALAQYTLLGEGGNGKVYQVPLQEDLVVAIKCVRNHVNPDEDDPSISHDAKQIRAELETLGFIRHRNLVQLLAYIFKSDSHLLVYEFMPRGSLQDALHQMVLGTLSLSWPARHRILCDVAQGLAYLHTASLGSSIVHRDLKPANILLDDSFHAKLGDFGLAAILPLKATHASTDVLAGTIGFIAPEYHQTMRYSQKSDVFSFGVVIAQLITARNPTDQQIVEEAGSIGQWLQKRLQANKGVDAIDPDLQGSGYETEILLAMKVAVFCTNQDPLQRPKGSEVLTMLLQIRTPEPSGLDILGLDSQGSDTPTFSSSGPLRFADSASTSLSY